MHQVDEQIAQKQKTEGDMLKPHVQGEAARLKKANEDLKQENADLKIIPRCQTDPAG